MEIFIAAFSFIGSVYGSRPQKSQTTEKLQVRESLGTYL